MSENDSKPKSNKKIESESKPDKNETNSEPPLYHAEGLLDNEEDDKFHHIEVVDVLETAILRSKGSINIALYGGWGTGKSTIINFLNSRINTQDKFEDYQHVVIDAWKLSPDVLRSELLEELALQLGISKEEREKIYDALHNVTEVQGSLILTGKEKAKKILIDSIPAYPIPIVLLAYFIGQQFGIDLGTPAILGGFAGSLILGVSGLFIKLSKKTESISKRFIQKAESSQKFAEIFEKILVVKKKKKLIITIDNLDRCDEKSAVRILSSVKTFMGNKDCVYVVPCDESALLHHLGREYNTVENPQHAKEFLRKFFQIIIYVPPNIKSDLSDYVDTLMQQFPNITFDSHVNEILISAGLSNPRKIRQYLYNLSIQFQLADLREKNSDDILTTGIITDNTGFLTKLIVIRDEWPTIYEKLQSLPTLLNSYHDYLREPTKIYDEDLSNTILNDFKTFPDFAKFMRATSLTVVDDIRPFLNLSQESYETIYEGSKQINSHASQNNIEELKQDLSSLTPEEILSSFNGLLSLIKYHIDNNNSQYAFNVMNSLLELYEQIPTELHDSLLEKFSTYLSSTPALRQSMNNFDLEKIFSLIMKMNSSVKEQLLSEYSLTLTKFRPINLKVVEQFVNYSNKIPHKIKEKFDDELNRLGSSDENEFVKVVKKLSETESGKSLIGPNTMDALAGRIGNTISTENEQKVSLFFDNISKTSIKTKTDFLNRLLVDLDPTKITAIDKNSQWILDTLIKYTQKTTELTDKIFNTLRKLLPKLQNRAHKMIVLKVIFPLLSSVSKTSLDKFAKTEFDINITIQNPAQFQEIVNLSKETNAQILNYDSIFEQMLNRLSSLPPQDDVYVQFIQEVPSDKLDQVLTMLQSKISSFDPNMLNVVITSITKSKEKLSSEQYDSTVKAIMDRLHQHSFDQNNVVYSKLFALLDTFSSKLLLDCATNMINWLDSNNPPQMNKAKSYLDKILENIPSDEKTPLFETLLNTLSVKLQKNQIEMVNIISPLIFDNTDSFDDPLKQKLIDLLCTQLVQGKPVQIQNFALDKLSKLGVVNDKVRESILSLRKLSPDGNVQKLCNKTCTELGIPFLNLSDPFEISGGKKEDGQISETLTKRITVIANEDGVAYLEYDVGINMGPKKNKSACSDVRIHINYDGKEIHVSDWLGYPGRPEEELPLSTGIIKLDGLPSDKCELEIIPEGRNGGCNEGYIGNWNGIIHVYELKKPSLKQ